RIRPVRGQSAGPEHIQQREGAVELPARVRGVHHVPPPCSDPLGHGHARADRDVLPGLREVSRLGYRWTVCALLFVVTTVNYIDRQVLGILAPTLQRELHWSETGYGDVVSWFTALYAVGFLVVGRWLDRVGVRRGFAVAVVAWSVAAIGHAVARTTAGFSVARALLGLGESANFPGAIKAVAEWFPKKERAPGQIAWLSLLGQRQTWAVVVGKFMTDPIWWFYLYWLPKFLDADYGIKLSQLALPLVVVYVVADAGSVTGGWLSGALMKRGWTVNRARKTALLCMALAIVPTALASRAGSLWIAVALVSVAAAAHQGWSANIYTLASDMFPRRAVASVIGSGGCVGALGGWLFQRATGRILDHNGNNYAPIFVVCGLAYVSAWIIIHVLAPTLQPARLAVTPEPLPLEKMS